MIYTILFIFMAYLFVFLAGFFDAAQTATRDLRIEGNSKIEDWIKQSHPEWMGWYLGGDNVKWNPSLPSIPWFGWWAGDMWHTCKCMWVAMWSIALGWATLAALPVWGAALLGFIAYGVEGFTFRIYYGHVFRIGADPWWTVLLDINPFNNKRK